MSEKNTEITTRLLRLPRVLELIPLAKSTLYAEVAAGRFPSPIKIGSQATAWVESDVKRWIDEKIEQSQAAA